MKAEGKDWKDLTLDDLETRWQEAKKETGA